MSLRSATINVMARAAMAAGRALRRDFGEIEHLQVSKKGPADFVSNADIKAERMVREALQKARPGYGFLMEESGAIAGSDTSHRWIVDPLDGTTNFLHGLPQYAVSIALERDGELIAGVIYDPVVDELYWAERGVGAFLNQQRLRVSARRRLGEALLGTGVPFQGRGTAEDHAAYLRQLAAVMASTAGVRRWGTASLDLAYVAAGRYDGFWENGLSPWDIAAGIVLLREAGGTVTQTDGAPIRLDSPTLLASNTQLHEALRDLLRSDTAARPGLHGVGGGLQG
jgi:myo-inositol-1(or 4)-monophosphatase